ncbi:hypothetical protein BH20ACT8_BH20ACT8_04000 [soil metagenome]
MTGAATPAELARRFAAALGEVEGDPEVLASAAEAHDRAVELVGERGAVVDAHPDLAGLADRVSVTDDVWAADVGVTGAVAAIAETGTLVLAATADTPRRTSLVPPVHIAVVPLSRLVATYADGVDAISRLDPPPSSIHLITGPSRSADIELNLVRGVHGPRDVHVLLYPDAG